jgi:hypothetical protein
MRQLLQILVLIVFVGSTSACSYVFGQTVKLKVEDQKGKPVPKAEVTMAFLRRYDGERKDEVTNEQGVVKMRGSGDLGIDTIVTKPGFYKSERRITGEGNISTSIRLREKRNPIPMYAKEVELFLPKKGVTYGYDLVKGDLVQPHGNGVTSHLYLTLKGQRTGSHDNESRLLIEFGETEGGVKAVDHKYHDSELAFPYEAPKKGYKPELNLYVNRGEEGLSTNVDKKKLGYVLKVVEAGDRKEDRLIVRYGKIRGYIHFTVGENKEKQSEGYVGFTYYLNPNPNDRNIEFDPQRNLFRNAEKTYPP